MATQSAAYVTLIICLTLPWTTAKIYNVTSANHVCILLDLDFQLGVTASKGGSEVSSTTLTPSNFIESTGSCHGFHRHISLVFMDSNGTYTGPFLNFRFRIQQDEVFLTRIFKFNPHVTFPELSLSSMSEMKFKDPDDLKLGEIGTSYKCLTKQSTSYVDVSTLQDNYTYSVNMEIKSMQVQGFFVHNSKFSDSKDCEIPHKRNTAQIIVGVVFFCVLMTGLVTSILLHVFCRRYREENRSDWWERSSTS